MKVSQAVIFCGGYGKRLLPLTRNTPKPMLLINDIPFLEYLINDIKKKYKINRFLLLVGYRNEIIRQYFKKKKIKIDYVYDPPNIKTGERLWNSRKKLDKFFLLFYSDNLFSFNYKSALSNFLNKKKTINFILKRKKLGNFNIKKNELTYSLKRNTRNPYVELGNMIVERDKLFPILKKNYKSDFKKTIYEIVKNIEYSFNVHEDIYCSIGDLDRYHKANLYLQKKKILFIDRDGFLTKKLPKAHYVKSWNDIVFIKQTINLLKILSKKGFIFIIITNQAGVSRKIVKLSNLKIINKNIKSLLKKKFNILIKDIFYCIHGWNSKCNCRKPNPGMFYKASEKYNINLSNCLYIGDDPRDCMAAYNANCKSIFYGKKSKINYLDEKYRPIAISKNVKYLLNTIINFYKC